MGLTDAEVAVMAAGAGADVVARAYGQRQKRFAKSATDFATQTDIDAESAIIGVLEQHRPTDARTGEELGSTGHGGPGRRWFVDPLCGTLNFAATTPLTVVNVALVDEDGADLAAAAADPISDEVFWTDGSNAYRSHGDVDQGLRPSARSGLVEVNCDGPLDRPFVGAQLVGDPLVRTSFGPRVISSSLGLAWVAAGRRAAYVSDGDFRDNVHFAAGIALCRAAGCVISDLAGDPLDSDRGLLVTADRETHHAMVGLVAPHLRAVRRDS